MHTKSKANRVLAVVLSALMLFGSSLVFASAESEVSYAADASLSCFINAMGGIEFGAKLLDGVTLTPKADGAVEATVNFTDDETLTIYTINCHAFINADKAAPGYYDANGELVTDVAYTKSGNTATAPDGSEVNYLESMTFTLPDLSGEYYLWLYVDSQIMGVQFCDGSGTASSNQPGQATKYKAILSIDVMGALGGEADSSLSCFISAMGGVEFGAKLLDGVRLMKGADGGIIAKVSFTDDETLNIFGINCHAFINADKAAPGYYDANGELVTDVAYTKSGNTATAPDGSEVNYLESMTFTLPDESGEYYLWLYVDSQIMGVQFCDGSGTASSNQPGQATRYKAVLTVDICSALGHSFTNYVSDGNATCVADGTKTAKCDRCDATDTIVDEGSATGHSYGEPTWKWDGVTLAEASFVCAEGDDTVVVSAKDGDITSEIVTEATATTAGKAVYTATVTFGGKTYTDSKTVTIPATNKIHGEHCFCNNQYNDGGLFPALTRFLCAMYNFVWNMYAALGL